MCLSNIENTVEFLNMTSNEDDRDPIRDAIGREAAAMIDSKDKYTFMAELAAKAVSVSEFEREQERLEMFPALVEAFGHALFCDLEDDEYAVAKSLFMRARALLP